MPKSWNRPALPTVQARKDFRDLVELCGLGDGPYEITVDGAGTVVVPAQRADGFPAAAEDRLDRAYALVAGDRPVRDVVLYERRSAARRVRPGGAALDPAGDSEFIPIRPGLFAGGPAVAELTRRLEDLFVTLAREAGARELVVPHLIAWETLQRAGYVTAFPQHLTACFSVRRELDAVDQLSQATGPTPDPSLLEPQQAVLAPAACYHLYPMLAGTTVEPGSVWTMVAACSRRELTWTPQPIRLWSFRMREIVHVGSGPECVRFRDRFLSVVESLAHELALPCRLESATDPFYTSRRIGQRSTQALRGLKYELVARDSMGNEFANTSVNLHRDHIGRAFDIRSVGEPAQTTCVGFGIERWAHWILSHCGPDPAGWPAPLAGSG